MSQPKQIQITLLFENEEENQTSYIDCSFAKSIWMESSPAFLKPKVESVGYNPDPRLGMNVYKIIVDYGPDGISVSDLVTDDEEVDN